MNISDFESMNVIKYNFPLSTVCTMKTGGNAKYAFSPATVRELQEIVLFLRNEQIKFIVIGNGSNVIFSDKGYDGAVVLTANLKDIKDVEVSKNDNERYIYVGAGCSLTSVALKMSKQGFCGLEFAYGIPASIGGAVYMNAGAYGGEMNDIIYEVEYLDDKGNIKQLCNNPSENYFTYRHSFFADHPEYIITGAVLKLTKAEGVDPMQLAEKNMTSRREKQPLEYPSCGSAFKRPQGYFAGALIEQAGLKGKNIGGAYVSEKHAGFIVNKGGATTTDIVELIKHVQSTVYKLYGVTLEPEIRIIED